MKHRRLILLTFFAWIFCIQQTPAQLYFRAKTLTTTDGLSDKQVTCFYKDRKGFMWIGTRNGLNLYDGHSFHVFRPSTGNSISNEVINDIAEDSKGNIWIATMKGLNSYDPVTGKWTCILPEIYPKRGLPNTIVWDIDIDKNDLMWIAPDVFEFCSFDIDKKKFTHYDWPTFARAHPEMKETRYHSIQRFCKKSDHEFWLGTTNGLVTLDIGTSKFQYIGSNYYGDVIDLKYDEQLKKVFLSVERGMVFGYDENTNSYYTILASPVVYPSKALTRPGKNEMWMASQNGLLKISDDRNNVLLETNVPQLSGSLLPGGVRSIFKDDQGLCWVATSNGISIYDPAVNATGFLPLLAVSDKEGINMMGGTFYDTVSHSYFVCATAPASVFIIDANSGFITQVSNDVDGRPLSYCNSIKADRYKNLWLLTNAAVYKYDRTRKAFTIFPTPNNGVDIAFRDLLHDTEGNYWFSTFHDGVYYYLSNEKKFAPLKDTSIKHIRPVTGLAEDIPNHKVLIGTYGDGVYAYDLKTGKAASYFETTSAPDYAQMSLATGTFKDKKGQLWLTTATGGIFRYYPNMSFEKTFRQFDMKSGLSSNNILSGCEGNDSITWLLSGKGITAININGDFLYDLKDDQTFNFSSYTSDARFTHGIFFNPEKNELLAAVGGGLLIYSPPKGDGLLNIPLVITGIKANGRALSLSEINTASARLRYRSNTILFEFAGLYYGALPGIQYEYRLEGYDDNWTKAGKDFTAFYQNLPPGNYEFNLRVIDGHGKELNQIKNFSFRIVPPFWKHWLFITLLVASALAILSWIIYSLLQKLKVERTVNLFATSLYEQNTTDDIFWDTARNCVNQLGFTDCVIYQVDERRNVLIQKAAYGPKNPFRREIANIIEIPLGKGITGAVAQTGKAVIINDTSKDRRYIIDDEHRLSEITVPVIVDGKVFAVIDSEHSQKHFFKKYHLRILKKIAAICAERLTRYLAEERLRAKIARDLHDEMGSTLTSINIISKVAMEEKPPQEKVLQSFQKIKDHSGRMMESMSDMVWAIDPVNDSFERVMLKMKEFTAEMLEPVKINYQLTAAGDLEKTQLNLEQRRDIYLIYKEAITNVVKYSQATIVTTRIEQDGKGLRLTISDNGRGFDTNQRHSGNGLRNMQNRAAIMGAAITINSVAGKGTTILLFLPVT